MKEINQHEGFPVNLPPHMKTGVMMPTPENLDRVAKDAADKRTNETQAKNCSPDALGRQWGMSRDFVLNYQRLEAKVIEQGRAIEWLTQQLRNPPHTWEVERRG